MTVCLYDPVRDRDGPLDETRCRAGQPPQHFSFVVGLRQCRSRATTPYTMPDGTVVALCKRHHPDAAAARDKKREEEQRKAQDAERRRKRDTTVRAGLRDATDDELRAECERRSWRVVSS